MVERIRTHSALRWGMAILAIWLTAGAAAEELIHEVDIAPPPDTGSFRGPNPSFAIPAAYMAPPVNYEAPYAGVAPYPPDVEAPYGGHPNHHAPYAPDVCRYDRVWRSPLSGKLWFRGTILGWTSKGQDLPVLATTSTAANPALATAGELGRGDTAILFGGGEVQGSFQGGGGMTLGFWHTPEQITGIELNWLDFDVGSAAFLGDSNGFDVLARPFFNVGLGAQDAQLTAFPGVLEGTLAVELASELTVAGVSVRRLLRGGPAGRVDFIAGYRHAHLFDRLTIGESLLSLDAASGFEPGTGVGRVDNFTVSNKFHGGEIGLSGEWFHGRWRPSLTGKAAFGGVRERAIVSAVTVVNAPDADPVVQASNLLARTTNTGEHVRNESARLYELNVMLDYDITCQWTVGVGYTLLYWDRVARVGGLIDTNVDFGAGAAQPALDFFSTDFWAQGLTFRFEYLF